MRKRGAYLKKITVKDIYEEMHKGRNFEITHLWQRSVFLAAFMVGIATAYGTVLIKIIEPDNIFTFNSKTYIPHLLEMGICYLGFIFSILWVMMSKGSKYWYERYETAINYFTMNFRDNNDCRNNLFEIDSINWCKQNACRKDTGDFPYHGFMPEPTDINESLLSRKAGHYSVSGVNCFIGIIGIFVWSLLNLIHGTIFFSYHFRTIIAFCLNLLQIWFISFFLYFVLRSFCKTGD